MERRYIRIKSRKKLTKLKGQSSNPSEVENINITNNILGPSWLTEAYLRN